MIRIHEDSRKHDDVFMLGASLAPREPKSASVPTHLRQRQAQQSAGRRCVVLGGNFAQESVQVATVGEAQLLADQRRRQAVR
ncbi:MAG: hypothetical protein JWR74_2105 [Polaromonas sp.]|nr:hypothetical protein [Polaromonas sp.]